MTRHLLPCLALLLAAPAGASDLKEPYKVRLVVYASKHRLLTDVFKQRVGRQLADGLQAALGPVAKVEVLDAHEKLEDIAARGLDRALTNYRARSGDRTYFVHLDLAGAYYQIQTRMHDGLTGLPSPTVRKQRTQDRDYVAREAALLIERDLGLLGTITSEPDAGRQVSVELKGGGIDKVDLSRWVKKGEVFSVVEVGDNGPGRVIDWTYLQVDGPPEKGVVPCKFYSRYKLKRVTGLRAVLLNTRSGPLRLRLRESKPGGGTALPALPLTVQIGHRGFDKEATMLEATSNGRRDLDTALLDHGVFNKLAFVTVLSGQSTRARAPVAITDAGVVLLTVPPGDEEDDRALFKFNSLGRNVADAYLVQLQLFKEINDLTARPEKRSEALAKVRLTLTRLQKDHRKLSEERNEVSKELEGYKGKNKLDLAGVDARLKVIKEGEEQLTKTVAALEKIEKQENDPTRREWLIQEQRARQLEKELEYGQAIAIYEKAPAEFQTPALKKHLDALRKLWATADDEHKKAREFIYDTWPKLDTPAKLKENLEKAREAFATCKKQGDKVGPARLLRATTAHLERVIKEGEELKPDVNVDDRKPAEVIVELLPGLRKLDRDLTAYLADKDKD